MASPPTNCLRMALPGPESRLPDQGSWNSALGTQGPQFRGTKPKGYSFFFPYSTGACKDLSLT